jgi:hypothetical protein
MKQPNEELSLLLPPACSLAGEPPCGVARDVYVAPKVETLGHWQVHTMLDLSGDDDGGFIP